MRVQPNATVQIFDVGKTFEKLPIDIPIQQNLEVRSQE
jgi:hypothetical protein